MLIFLLHRSGEEEEPRDKDDIDAISHEEHNLGFGQF
jgi:hypothetical protein